MQVAGVLLPEAAFLSRAKRGNPMIHKKLILFASLDLELISRINFKRLLAIGIPRFARDKNYLPLTLRYTAT
jgi:hypothetical protein